MIFEEKAPYLFTILFVALGWTITQVVSDLAKSPLIEYESSKNISPNETKHVFTVTNISLERSFTDLLFKLRFDTGSGVKCIEDTEIVAIPPTELKNPKNKKGAEESKCENGKYSQYKIPKLQPGATVQLIMYTNKDVDVVVYIWSDNPVKLVESSVLTKIVKNRLCILLIFMFIGFSLIIIYTIVVSKKFNKNTKDLGEG